MLILSRRQGQSIIISDSIEISVAEIKGDQVRIGIAAPRNVKIFRKEIHEQIQEAMRHAAQNRPDETRLLDLQKLLQGRVKKK